MFGLGSIFPASTMLGMVCTEIEKQLEKDVPEFAIIYKAKDHSLVFRIPNGTDKPDFHGYDSNLISDAVKAITNQQLNSEQKLDYVIVNYSRINPKNNIADIYYQNKEGVKETTQFKY